MSRSGLASLAVLALVAPATPAGAEWFLTPSIEGAGGYTSNRFAEPDAHGSAYWRTQPGLELTWFGPDQVEASARILHSRTDFLRSGFSWLRQTSGDLEIRRGFPKADLAVTASGGVYEDAALPGDNSTWGQLSPFLAFDLTSSLNASLALSVTHTRYWSARTLEGDRETATLWAAAPALRWSPSDALSFWVELSTERNDSNEDTDDYWTAGGSVGIDIYWAGSGRSGIWGQWRLREYANRPSDDGGDRRDTPFDVGAWAAYRLAPWAEVTSSGSWSSARSDEAGSDYDLWVVEAGLRFVYDWQLGGSTR